MTRPIIFLDIDGVLRRVSEPMLIRPEKAALIDALAEQHDALVCVTSSWRLLHPLSFFQSAISIRVLAALPTDESTCRTEKNDRGSVIRSFLQQRYADTPPPFAILDDQPDLFTSADHAHCVFVDPDNLLSAEDVDRAAHLLSNRP